MSIISVDFRGGLAPPAIGSIATEKATIAASMVRPMLIECRNIRQGTQRVKCQFCEPAGPTPNISVVSSEGYRRHVHKLDFGPP
jgi:hypothetical protein